MESYIHQKWADYKKSFKTLNPSITFQSIKEQYGNPNRYYHTLNHIEACLKHFEKFKHTIEDPSALSLPFGFMISSMTLKKMIMKN